MLASLILRSAILWNSLAASSENFLLSGGRIFQFQKGLLKVNDLQAHRVNHPPNCSSTWASETKRHQRLKTYYFLPDGIVIPTPSKPPQPKKKTSIYDLFRMCVPPRKKKVHHHTCPFKRCFVRHRISNVSLVKIQSRPVERQQSKCKQRGTEPSGPWSGSTPPHPTRWDPLPVINGVITPRSYPFISSHLYNRALITPLKTGPRGPPCKMT